MAFQDELGESSAARVASVAASLPRRHPEWLWRVSGDTSGPSSGVAAPASISMPSDCIIWINTNQKICMKARLKNIIPFPSNRALVFNVPSDTGHCLQITSTSCQLNNDSSCDEDNRILE